MADKEKPSGTPPRKKASGGLFSLRAIREKLGLPGSGGRGVVGMQFTSSIMRIIEIDKSTDPPRVVNFSSIDPLMEDLTEAADQIRGLMEEKGITARVANSLVCDQGVEHRLVPLPVLGRSEMQVMMRREVKKILPDVKPREIAFDYWQDRSSKKGARKLETLIGVVPRETPRRIIKMMELVELDTQVISTVPMALIAVSRLMGKKAEGKVVAMVHLERDRSFIVIANRGNWIFSREFPSVLVTEEAKEPQEAGVSAGHKFVSARYMADKDRLLTEVNRSFLYFKQRFRGEGVSLAILSGEAFNLDEVAVEFNENLGIETEQLAPDEGLEYDHLGERAGKLERIFPSLALPVGAALESAQKTRLNFVPPAYLSRRLTRLRRMMMVAASAALVLAATTGYILLRKSSAEAEELYNRKVREDIVSQLTSSIEKINQVTNERNLARARRSFLDRFIRDQGPEQELLLAVSHMVPDDIVLFMVTVDRPAGNKTQIGGKVEKQTGSNMDKSLNIFYQELRDSGLFSSMAEPQTEIVQDPQTGSAELNFNIDCNLGM
ncbi:MAG: pilus assembly protein PilM [Gemmatimonadota bacterium]|nr:pilus assembly protein PilM [Gemmatimonadota bacterium]